MLEKLTIKNYLLLKNIEIDFSKGFNVITGETGAGKTILVNALSLLFGERADYSVIKKNKEKMLVEGMIKLSKRNSSEIENFISSSGASSLGDQLIVRRELYSKGYSRTFINDSPVNINDLKTLGEILVDVHSQNEHQSLLNKEIHIDILDSFLFSGSKDKFLSLVTGYKKEFLELTKLAGELDILLEKKREIESKREFLEFQLREIKEVSPFLNEDEEIEREIRAGENSEGILRSLSISYGNLYDEEGAILERLKTIKKELSSIQEYDPEIEKILKEISDADVILGELSRQIQTIRDNLSFDPDKMETLRERLYKLQFLKKKYGNSLENVLNVWSNAEKDLELLDNFDENIKNKTKEIGSLKSRLYEAASLISGQRKKGAAILEEKVKEVLNEVGLENAEFRVRFGVKKEDEETNFTLPAKSRKEYIKLAEHGFDDVEFLIKVNKGDDFSQLSKTASGGEISRIMLAIKTVLAGTDKVDILIFDEIDTGISGRIAQKVGRVLKKLSTFHQVISVSHLAQIAALADEHFLVEKESGTETTETRINKLDSKEKVLEVAKLLSGEKVTDSSIKSARELIEDKA